jgi:GrpB-like predicted nucleotidyltransferase (UPF0157 family)
LTPLERYRDALRAIPTALHGVSDEELNRRWGTREWTIREVVHHLADSEMVSAVRIRRILTEERPLIQTYDQEELRRRLAYDRPIGVSLEIFLSVRQATAEILERLSAAEWEREGVHEETGPYTLRGWLERNTHAEDHAEQIRRLRRGRPLVIAEYDPAWPKLFDVERARLWDTLGAQVLEIEHVGSTAVLGLAAKPILDIDVVLVDEEALRTCIPLVEGLGYTRAPIGDFDGRTFLDGPGDPIPVHLSLGTVQAPILRKHRILRDRLRADPALARRYADLKRRLAAEYGTDREGYATAKTEFITGVTGLPRIG